jgi:hypothetical protein
LDRKNQVIYEVNEKSEQALIIQKAFRGHLGRQRFMNLVIERNQTKRLTVYHEMATKIQKM